MDELEDGLIESCLHVVEKFHFYGYDSDIVESLESGGIFFCGQNSASGCMASDVVHVFGREVVMVRKTHQFDVWQDVLEIVSHLEWGCYACKQYGGAFYPFDGVGIAVTGEE